MSKLTATAVLLLVLIAVLSEQERRGDLARIEALQTQPFPPVRPAVQWPPAEPAPKQPTHATVPKGSYEMLPAHRPFHLEEMP